MGKVPSGSTDLIYDVGMHLGDDTAFYLSQGFKVVGIEANPDLAATARQRFSSEIRSGQLTVVNAGIAKHPERPPSGIVTRTLRGTLFKRRLPPGTA